MKLFKRVIAIALMLIMAIPAQMPVYANMQSYARNIKILGSGSKGNFNVVLTWDPIVKSTTTDPTSNILEPSVTHETAYIDINQRNASIRGSASTTISPPRYINPTTFSGTLAPDGFQNSGCIYAFSVNPGHTHRQYTDNTNTNTRDIPAVMDTNTMQGAQEALFLTDIQVNATGVTNAMTVVWDYPIFYDTNQQPIDLFDGYIISYTYNTETTVRVPVDKCTKLTDRGVQRLSYTIRDEALVPGTFYTVKVEPAVYSGGELVKFRNTGVNGQGSILVKDKFYSIAYTGNDYVTQKPVGIDVNLWITEDGKDFIILNWSQIIGNNNTTNQQKIKSIEVYSASDINQLPANKNNISNAKLLFTLGSDYASLTTARVERPTGLTYYRIYAISQNDGQIVSNIAVYSPGQIDIKPLAPFLTVDKVNAADANDITKKSLDLVWKAFLRNPVNDSEIKAAQNGLYLDLDVTYDLWITDDPTKIDDPNLKPMTFGGEENPLNVVLRKDPVELPWIAATVSEYQKFSNGSFDSAPITTNNVYTLKIVAKKKIIINGAEVIRESDPFYLTYTIGPSGEIGVPKAVAKPPLKLTGASQNTLTVEWRNTWFEVMAPNGNFYSFVGIDKDGKLVFGEKDALANTVIDFALADSESAVKEIFKTAGFTETAANPLIIRRVMLNDLSLATAYPTTMANYEYKILPYNGNESVLMALDQTAEDYNTGWYKTNTDITTAGGLYDYIIGGESGGPKLVGNTSYIILFRAYRIIGGQQLNSDPSFLVGTTNPPDKPVDIEPTVPYLFPYSSDDGSVTVYWNRTSGLSYELSYNPTFLADPSKGKLIDWNTIQATYEIVKGKDLGLTDADSQDTDYIKYTIQNLFPNTEYYFWVRSAGTVAGAQKTSPWSNPVMYQTKDLATPTPPDGLGLAGSDNLDAYNKANDTKLVPLSTEYMVVEWLRDVLDTGDAGKDGNIVTIGAGITAKPDQLESIYMSYMARFQSLTANTTYFLRAKTILTVTMDKDIVTRTYNYAVDIATDITFADYIEFIVPKDMPPVSDTFYIQKESIFTNVIAITTGTTTGEYDGQMNPNLVPLPTQDYDITYDRRTNTLAFRFRSNQKDSSGNMDNLVDQRFISKLIADKTFDYTVDLSKFGNEVIKVRTLQLPYSIYAAFQESKIRLNVVTGQMSTVISPGALNTREVNALPDMGKGATVNITITENPTIAKPADKNYLSTPQQWSISVTTPTRTVQLNTLNAPLAVNMKLNSRAAALDSSANAYLYTANTGGWIIQNGQYDSLQGAVKLTTPTVGAYTVLGKPAPLPITGIGTNAPYIVNAGIGFTDMTSYDPNALLSAMQLNKLMAAISENRREVAVNSPITNSESDQLYKAGLFISGSTVTRENAINRLIRLYEIKTKSQIGNYTNVSVADLTSASAVNRPSIQKAAKLGLISGNARPTENMTFGECLEFIAAIIEDGYK